MEDVGRRPSKRLFNYSKLAFPHEQYDPEPVIATVVGVITGKIQTYRNVEPKEIIPQQRKQLDAAWELKVTGDLGKRNELVEKAFPSRKKFNLCTGGFCANAE